MPSRKGVAQAPGKQLSVRPPMDTVPKVESPLAWGSCQPLQPTCLNIHGKGWLSDQMLK